MENGGGGAGDGPSPQSVASPTAAEELKRIQRGEVDYSPLFRSVREAAAQFGGSAAGQWKPLQLGHVQLSPTEVELMKVEEQIVKLDMDLFVKERQTLSVLKELEMTKKIVDDLKLQLQEQGPKHDKIQELLVDNVTINQVQHVEEKFPIFIESLRSSADQKADKTYQSPGSILMELKQAKMNLGRTKSGITGIRASVDFLNCKISEEKVLLKKAQEKIRLNTARIINMEQDLSREMAKLKISKETRANEPGNFSDVLSQIKQLEFEKKTYSKMREDAKSEIWKLNSEIEELKSCTKTAEVRCITAKKMETAARSAEATALAKIKDLRDSKDSDATPEISSKVELSVQEYAKLMPQLHEADETSKRKVEAAMLELKEAEQSKLELLEKVEEAIADVQTSRKVLELALKREEDANREKRAAEEALRKSRLEPNKRTWTSENSSKFKKNSATPHHTVSQILDVNGLSLVASGTKSSLRPSLSIGQILSRRWTTPEENKAFFLQKINGKPRVSLGQILSMKPELFSPLRIDDTGGRKQHFPLKKKKFGIFAIRLFLARQSKKKKEKQASTHYGSKEAD